MVSEKRRRELARAKWERQQARRRARAARFRTLQIAGGVAVGVVALVLVGLGIRALVGGDAPGETFPTENTLTLKQPPTDDETTGPTSTGPTQPTVPTRSSASTGATPTAPVTTATTGSGTP